MSQDLINHSPDLKRLVDEGYCISIVSGHLLVERIPYVSENKEVLYGTIVSTLETSDGRTVRPQNHKVWFIGEPPCKWDGKRYDEIINNTNRHELGENLVVNLMFSTKPKPDSYTDYHHKIYTHINLLSAQAEKIDSTATARHNRPPEISEDSDVLVY